MVVLAAGGSTRLGTPKQLLPYHGTTLLRHAAEVALAAAARSAGGMGGGAGASERSAVAVVIGAEAQRMRAELAGLHVQLVVNPRWQEGLSTSLDAALAVLEATAGVDAVLFTTCDQPRVTPTVLRRLVDVYAAGRAPAVACAYAGTVGAPALFDRSLFPELRALRGDAGAKSVIQRHLASVASVPFPEGELDVDTGEDARRLASEPGEP